MSVEQLEHRLNSDNTMLKHIENYHVSDCLKHFIINTHFQAYYSTWCVKLALTMAFSLAAEEKVYCLL